MLTLREARVNFIALQIASFLHWLPFNFDGKNGRIWLKSTAGWVFFTFNFVCVVLHELNFIRTLIKIKVEGAQVPFTHLSNHVIFIFSMASDLSRAASYFFKADEIALVFNELYYKKSTSTELPIPIQNGKRKAKQRTFQDRLARWFIATPIMIPFLAALTIAGDPGRVYAIGNAFGFPHGSMAFNATIPFEFLMVNFLTTTLMFVQFAQLSVFEKINLVAAEETRSLKKGKVTWNRLSNSYRVCRQLQVYIRMENVAFSRIAFISKLVGIISTTLHMFFALQLIHVSPVDGIANAIMGIIVFGTMLGIYDKAYRVLSGVKMLQRQLLDCSLSLHSESEKSALKASVRSIKNEGIRMGGFYNVERQATMISIGFILGQVVSLLVAFR